MKINHFQVNSLEEFCTFTVLYNLLIYLLANYFHPKGDPIHKQSPSMSLALYLLATSNLLAISVDFPIWIFCKNRIM